MLYIDLETRSPEPITSGVHRYAERAEVLLVAFAVDGAPAKVWDVANGEPTPPELRARHATIVAHNSAFDRTVLRHAMPQLVSTDPEDWLDTAAQAAAHSLPPALADLCDVLHVPASHAKDPRGKRLIRLFCIDGGADRNTHPDEWAQFIEYARLDVEAMRACQRRMPAWNYPQNLTEVSLWWLDQTINDRGVAIDIDLAQSAMAAVAEAQQRLDVEVRDLTNGAVRTAQQRNALLAHINFAYNMDLPDLTAATVADTLARGNLSPRLRALLENRASASTTSNAKYRALLDGVSEDGRLRGTLQYCGASRTGRWAGRLFQPQNLPRPTMSQTHIDIGVEALKAGCADVITDDVIGLASSALRGVIIAKPGNKLVVADLSNIEGRVLAWLAGERWKLDAFRAFDSGTGPDLYKLAYANAFRVAPEMVSKDQRQIGKVMELALGYQGGVGAFSQFAAAYGIDLDAMAENAALPDDVTQPSRAAYARAETEMSELAWVACDTFKRLWRAAHPATVGLWRGVEDMMMRAIDDAGSTYGRVSADRVGKWVRIRLPSGRYLNYPGMRNDDGMTYQGLNTARKWTTQRTYSGKLVENITQAVARDVLAANMRAIEAAGYRIVLTVHDEIIAETPDTDEYSADALSRLMAAAPPWAEDLPLAAAGFECWRYRKD